MKKFYLLTMIVISFATIGAQENEKQRKNDILADPVLLIAVPMANITYERLLNKDMGVGVNAMITLNDDIEDFKQISPYFRYYLGEKYASGFFFEGFVPVTSQKDGFYGTVYDEPTNTNYYSYKGEKTITTVGIGFGVGGKWVIKKRLVIEASGGIARRLGSNIRDYDLTPVTGKIMGGVGYRF